MTNKKIELFLWGSLVYVPILLKFNKDRKCRIEKEILLDTVKDLDNKISLIDEETLQDKRLIAYNMNEQIHHITKNIKCSENCSEFKYIKAKIKSILVDLNY